MDRRRRRWLVGFLGISIALVLVAVLILVAIRQIGGTLRGEASFQGRPTSYWRQVIRERMRLRSIPPSDPFYNPQPEAVPVLLELLREDDVPFRREVLTLLRDIGPRAKAAVPAVTEQLRDPAVREWAGEALQEIDPKAAARAGVKRSGKPAREDN